VSAKKITSLCPWWLEHTDLNPADGGEIQRDSLVNGSSERQFGLVVHGTFDATLVLGMIAIRCERKGDQVTPLSMMWADVPPVPLPRRVFYPPRGYEPYLDGRVRNRIDNEGDA
jgi:hypothetical protein